MNPQSPQTKASNLAEQLKLSIVHETMTPEEQDAMDQFFNSNWAELEKIIQLYFDTIRYIEKDESYQFNQPPKGCMLDINTICDYLSETFSRLPKYNKYSKEIEEFMDIFLAQTANFITQNPVEKYSLWGYRSIEILLQILAKSSSAYKYTEQLEQFEAKMNSEGKVLNSQIKESLIRSFLYKKRKTRINGGIDDSEIFSDFHRCENYLLQHAITIMQTGNIDTIWQDEVLNVILQLRAVKDIGESSQTRNSVIELEKLIEGFITKNFSQSNIEQAKATLEDTITKYKDKAFIDSEEQDTFLKAYKTVYLSELLGQKQRDPSAISPECALFILRQMEYFIKNNIKPGVDVDVQTIMMRTVQDIIIKENQRQLTDLGDPELKDNDRLVVLDHPNIRVHQSRGSLSYILKLMNMCTERIFGKDSCRFLIETIYHELDHYDRTIESKCVGFHDYIGFKSSKSVLLFSRDDSVSIANYYNLYHELCAYLSGKAAEIRSYIHFPAGKSPEETVEKIDSIVDDELKRIENATCTNIRTEDPDTGQWIEQSDIQAYDKIVSKCIFTTSKAFGNTLKFEYYENGRPKTLEAIIQDQKNELQGENNPEVGPIEKAERAKIRFQIMIERAMSSGEEEKCLKLINTFVMEHQELFEKDNILGQTYNPDTIKGDLKTKKREALKEGTPEGIQDAIFLHILDNMLEKINQKHKFADEMFDFLFRTQTRKITEKANSETKTPNSPNNIPQEQTQ